MKMISLTVAESGHKKWEIKFKNRFPKVTILNWKSIAKVKTLNSNSLSSKAISIIGNSKAMIDIRQLWIRGCENVVLNSQFPLWPPLSPSPNFFLRRGGPCFFAFAFKKMNADQIRHQNPVLHFLLRLVHAIKFEFNKRVCYHILMNNIVWLIRRVQRSTVRWNTDEMLSIMRPMQAKFQLLNFCLVKWRSLT